MNPRDDCIPIGSTLGVHLDGQRLAMGELVSLEDDVAAPLVATGALERISEPKPKPKPPQAVAPVAGVSAQAGEGVAPTSSELSRPRMSAG